MAKDIELDKVKKTEDVVKKAHSTFLTDEEKKAIEAAVHKEIEEENKKQVAADYKASIKSAATRKLLLKDAEAGATEDGLVPVFVDLPSVAECIRLDGVAYYPGKTYNVRPEVRDVINECMDRGRDHEDSLNGKTAKENMNRRQNTKRVQ